MSRSGAALALVMLVGCAMESRRATVPPSHSAPLRAIDLAVSETQACAVTSDGALYCWGDDTLGGLGTGALESSDVPRRADTGPVVDVELERHRGCAITTDRGVVCWGVNSNGQSRPSRVADPLPHPLELAICAMGEDPDADWDNVVVRPARIEGVADVVSLSLTFHRTCALSRGGHLTCWGENRDGVLGTTDERSFVRVESDQPGAVAVIATPVRTFVVDGGGRLRVVHSDRSEAPEPPAPLTSLQISERGGCGRAADGAVVCWGHAGACFGDDEVGTWRTEADARQVAIAWGACVRCYLDGRGAARCWPSLDELASGEEGATPFAGSWILEAPPLARIELGSSAGCGIDVEGRIHCWDLDTTSTPETRRARPVTLPIGPAAR